MENILYNISQVFGTTIIHSLWQGMLVYFLLRMVFAAAPALSAVKKYNLAIVSLALVSLLFIYTLLVEIHSYSWLNAGPVNFARLLPSFKLAYYTPVKPSFFVSLAVYMPYICTAYFAGLLVNIFKLAFEWNKIRQIKRSVIPAEQMQQFITKFSKRLDISKPVQLKFSQLVDVPCIIGCFKPLILLPVSIATQLSACEIEAILLHELSHIKRNDYLVNIAQQVITILLFFNPFAHLVNRIIHQERENSCDDLVIEKTRKPLIYARALLKLEETRVSSLPLALAATGKKYHLLNRIERIMKTNKPIGNIRHLVIVMFLLAGSLGSLAWFNPKTAVAATRRNEAHQLIAKSNFVIDTTKQAVINTDANRNLFDSDTIKHPRKGKTTVKGKKGDAMADSVMEEADSNFYSGTAWRQQMEIFRKQRGEIRKQFNSPEWKAQMDAMKKQGEQMKKQFNKPEWKAQMLAMKKQGEEMKKQFDSPEWKAQTDAMKKQGEQMKKQFDSPEWKAQMDAMKKQGEQMKKQFDSPEWKAQQEQWKKQAEDLKKQFNSPKWKAQMDAFKKQGEEMRKKFDSPEWKKQMEDIKKQGEEWRKKFNSPEWKKAMKDKKWKLRDTVGGVEIYEPAKKDSL
ncbi:M56 family metallopeptidase [Mucilaginibacter gotjawali]|uniref:Regulatory protein BlaR1 n=2 Tax=Mucilaginibacter gotjawali TaxID=1550579 RepID=A0A0X8X6Q2_9SPHI|nr:M56 family metallopeptidase [Mucilaginibacter gotjawali]MBB3055295.1 beta-lactamase regulating signal transducer with metallopeptidase domain/pterin-4a-carbinolamine dehydratase [Mucilaginibacter gotjawali]BAU56087.1 Regulatory protein BlaR1 [Mucilaginibacter gotjawali]